MPKGMLGGLTLSEVRGPRDTLENNLASERGWEWLEALNKMLRGENPWPIVEKVHEGYSIEVGGDPILVGDSVYSNFDRIDEEAWEIILSKKFTVSTKKQTLDVFLLEFPWGTENLRPAHVLTEITRLGFERPSLEDAFRFADKYPDVQKKRKIVFLHEPVKVKADVGIGGMAVGCDEFERFDAVFELSEHGVISPRILTTENVDFLTSATLFAARRALFGERKILTA